MEDRTLSGRVAAVEVIREGSIQNVLLGLKLCPWPSQGTSLQVTAHRKTVFLST